MDIYDKASEIEQRERQLALMVRKPTLPARGTCYNCDEPVRAGACYCDADCREDHEKRLRAGKNA